jgi:acetylornithine deacetylase/succinyl-diaminopimelate desuccinylase-like protein
MNYLYIILIISFLSALNADPDWDKVELESVKLFQEYLRIDTSNPPGDVTEAIAWIAKLLEKESIDFETFIVPEDPRRMHILANFPGMKSELKPLLLLSHVDVVPADYDSWSVDPFEAKIIDDIIYARGALDMKCLGMMQLMAMILLKREGWIPERTVKLLAVADEETLGEYGVQWMIENHWDKLDPEWVWDEGGIGSKDSFPGINAFAVAVAQKISFWVNIEVKGKSGHGSRPFDNYPNKVLANGLNKIVNWNSEIEINTVTSQMFNIIGDEIGGFQGFVMKNLDNRFVKYLFGSKVASTNPTINAMMRNTISLTKINSGYKTNIIPEYAEATLDIRLLPDTEPDLFINELQKIVDDENIKFIPKRIPINNYISNYDTDFYNILSEELKSEVSSAVVFPFMTIGGTDSQFFQTKGVNCYGLIPILVTEDDIHTMHGIDERISIDNFMLGSKIVYNTIKRVCSTK